MAALGAAAGSGPLSGCGGVDEAEVRDLRSQLKLALDGERRAQDALLERDGKPTPSTQQRDGDVRHKLTDAGIPAAERDALVRRSVEAGLRSRQLAARNLADREMIDRDLRTDVEAGTLRLDERDAHLRIVLPEEALFASGTMVLSPIAHKVLEDVAHELAKLPTRRLLVGGHTDNKVKGNFALAVGRARAVAESLLRLGVQPGRITIAGYAENEPAGDLSTDEGRARSRRVEVVFMSGEYTPEAEPPPPPPKPPAPPVVAAPVKVPAAKAGRGAPKPPKAGPIVTDDPGLQ